jgi:hypothetical protein
MMSSGMDVARLAEKLASANDRPVHLHDYSPAGKLNYLSRIMPRNLKEFRRAPQSAENNRVLQRRTMSTFVLYIVIASREITSVIGMLTERACRSETNAHVNPLKLIRARARATNFTSAPPYLYRPRHHRIVSRTRAHISPRSQ